MKNLTIAASVALLSTTTTATAEPVTISRNWTESFTVSTATPQLSVENIWGSVRIRPGASGEISVAIDELRTAPNQELFQRSLETLKLNIASDSGGLSIRVGERGRSWEHGNSCRNCRVDYQFEVLVPPGTQVDAGTVIDGTVDVAGVTGPVSASNVNGPISISDLQDCGVLESVNGPVDLVFVQSPDQNCSIETVNGDITLELPNGSGLDVALDMFNGRMVSEFQIDPFVVPAQVEHSLMNGRHRYQIQQSAGLRLDGGGPTFSISSLNGDVNLQKTQ